MRYILLFLIILALNAMVPAVSAAETVLGKVISIDMEQKEMTIQPIHAGSGDAEPEPIILTFSADDLPAGIEPGSIIRVWGGYTDANQAIFQCSGIRLGGRGPGNDPTGVRSRIGRSCETGGSGRMTHHGPGGPGHGR